MDVNKNIVITLTKEELIELVTEKVVNEHGYEFDAKDISFVDKRNNKVKLAKVVISGAKELPSEPAMAETPKEEDKDKGTTDG